MKVFFIGGGFRFWGMEQGLLTLEEHLQERGVQCLHVTSTWSDGVFNARLAAAGIENHAFKLGRLYLTKPSWTFATLKELPQAGAKLRKLVRSFKPDVVVHVDNRFFLVIYPILLGLKCRHVYCEAVTPSRAWVDALIYRLIFASCSSVIAHSIDTEQAFRKMNLGRSPIITVEYGIDCRLFTSNARGAQTTTYIGIVGQIIPRKGHDILLKSLMLLKRRRLDVCLVIIGEGDKEFSDMLKSQIADWRLDDSIWWMGVIQDKSIIYSQFDILAVPSRSEAFGLVAAEAGASCLPVVASRVGGLQHVIADGESGILVEPENAEQLSDALERLITNPALRNSMGMAGRHRVESRFSPEQMAENFLRAVQ
jgi:glycosyltransferase involved in cell wall biosynthesis